VHSLPLFHRLTDQPVMVVGEGEAAEAKRRLLERAGAVVVGEDDSRARIAFIAMADPGDCLARLKARGLLVNVVDRPELCDFTTPSVLERGPVLVAVATGGASAGLAKALRLRLEALLPQSLGLLAQGLADARQRLREKWSDGGERRRALDAALADGGMLDPLDEGSAARLDQWLVHGEAEPFWHHDMMLRSDDPDDLSLREARWLGQADLIVHDPAVPPAILARARADAARSVLEAGQGAIAHSGNVLVIRRR
jgi:uroporphyrin-III C-methyltransferase/precorrin-2 dehydrogenase/sirohydrochlorin ferrochelatase